MFFITICHDRDESSSWKEALESFEKREGRYRMAGD
jgi:hypothetical protein